MRIEVKNVANPRYGYLAVFAVHLCIVVWLVHGAWIVSHDRELLMFALLLGQASVIAMWSAAGASARWLRITVAPIGIAACWFNLAQSMSWSTSDAFAMFWAIVIVTQSLVIVVVLKLRRLRTSTSGSRTFRLSSLVWATVIAATAFALIRFAGSHLKWSPTILNARLILFWIAVGLINAAIALIAASAAKPRPSSVRWPTMLLGRLLRVTLAFASTIVLAMILHGLLTWGFTGASEGTFHLAVFLGTQAATVYISLVIVRSTSGG